MKTISDIRNAVKTVKSPNKTYHVVIALGNERNIILETFDRMLEAVAAQLQLQALDDETFAMVIRERIER